jgi:hypothetical protein
VKRGRKELHFLFACLLAAALAMIPLLAKAADSPYDGWWYTAGQDGTGISIEIQGNILFMAWYTYSQSGQPIWHISGGPMSSPTQFSGDFKLATGTPLNNLGSWSAPSYTPDGTVQIAFTSATQATIGWTGVGSTNSGSKTITKFMQDFSPGCLDSRDINGWWFDPAYNGMGFFIEARGGSLFMAWYHYRQDGSTRWWSAYSNPGAFPSGSGSFNSTFHFYTGGQYIGGNWQQNAEQTSPSTVNLTFVSFSDATLAWTGGPTLNLQRFWFGGMAGLPAVTYTGKNTAAAIDQCNAVTIAGQALRGTYVIALFKELIPTDEIPLNTIPAQTSSALAWFSPLSWLSLLQNARSGHVTYYTISNTIPGNCGGTISYIINRDADLSSMTEEDSGTFSANDLCNNGARVNGSATLSGNIDLSAGTGTLTLTLNQITLSYPPKSDVTLDGNVTGVLNASGLNLTVDIVKRNNNLGNVFWMNNYTVTASYDEVNNLLNLGQGSCSFELTGRFYHPDYGYVDLSTPTGIQAYVDLATLDIGITSGAIVCTGNASTKAKLTPLSADTFEVQADANGDGIYDWDSGVLLISDYE